MEGLRKKIVLLATTDINGAYEAVYNISKYLNNEGFEIAMVVKTKTRKDSFIHVYNQFYENNRGLFFRILNKIYSKLMNKFYNKEIIYDPKYSFYSINEQKKNISPKLFVEKIGFKPDIILNGITINFMNSTDLLALQKYTDAQVYNIIVDMNHFTGGCHYAWDCKGYITGCNDKCPAILTESAKHMAKLNFETKLKNARLGNFKIIAGSGWTLNQAKKSMIYKHQKNIININSFIDTNLHNNKSRTFAKKIFDLKEDKFYILMGCQNAKDPRKGFEYLVEALITLEKQITEEQKNKIEILVVSHDISHEFKNIPFTKKHIDYIKDYRLLSLLYQASNVFVNSSIEDSGPMMVSEALACGTPVVGFDMGVVSNMVINDYNGYKAILKDSTDLAKGINKILNLTTIEFQEYSDNAIQQVKEFSSLNEIKKQFNFLYE